MKFWVLTFFAAAVQLALGQDDCICYQEVATDLSNPLLLVTSPDDTGRKFVAEQTGFVYIYDADWNRNPEPFLNLSNTVVVNPGYDERGFLCMAFHPDFQENNKVFIYYNTERDDGAEITRLSQVLVEDDNPNVVDYDSEIAMLELEQPFTNHNGATIMFLLDGTMLVTLGDGGSGGDPFGNAQNKEVLLGKILRINVDDVSEESPYTVPEDNPFIDEEGTLPEIYSLGWRNPWRCDLDQGDLDSGENAGRVFCGDVGQDAWEEIDILEAGGNFGWNAREGNACFDEDLCGNIGPEVLPIYDYSHDLGSFISVTGGVVYRGCENPHLNGIYIFADLSLSVVWQLEYDEAEDEWPQSDLNVCGGDVCSAAGFETSIGRYILSFGEDREGEVFVLTTNSLNPFETSGIVFKIVNPEGNGACDAR